MSTSMGGGRQTTFPGVFSCSFDESTGRCSETNTPGTVVDATVIGGDRDRGVNLSNILLNAGKRKLLALRTDTFWEILWAPLDSNIYSTTEGSATSLLPYFRIPKEVYSDESKGQDCGAYTGTRFAYYEVIPVAFAIDDNEDVYISWEGYFQDCEDPVESENGLVWSVGVNKINRSCIMTDRVQSFAECTSPHAVFYRGLIGKDRRLGSGLAISMSPKKRQLFYLSIVNRAYEMDNASEIWVSPQGIHKTPSIVPTPKLPNPTAYQATRIIPDVASIQLDLDSDQLPRAVCQTVYDQGVYCYEFGIQDDGEDIVPYSDNAEPTFVVTKEQVAESCVIDTNINGGEDYMSGLTTGLQVVWGEDHHPDLVIFGCYGRLSDRGNMTTVFRDGTAVQVIQGAYPGSILFGIDMNQDNRDIFWSDVTPVPVAEDDFEATTKDTNTGLILGIVFAALFGMLVLGGFVLYMRGKANNGGSTFSTLSKYSSKSKQGSIGKVSDGDAGEQIESKGDTPKKESVTEKSLEEGLATRDDSSQRSDGDNLDASSQNR